ncbi:hypothetical protein CTI12_AA017470 [Artemisia annua]|uniref:Uncharacterized protein n=1 Tax=Artemisia annua TaxID=35608 RepID=A0A2U1Q8B9_ARTAN|nr:hypothetical protein CTI12_AA017470 [Artemisia annua]
MTTPIGTFVQDKTYNLGKVAKLQPWPDIITTKTSFPKTFQTELPLDCGCRWLMALYVDVFIDVVVIAAWVIYKESSWIVAAAFTVLLCVFGSIATCGYVILQFYKLSPEEFTKDPLYFVLVRHQKRDGIMGHRRGPSVIAARVFFSVLGCFMLGIWIYLLIVYGSPFRAKVFTPCMVGTLINFDANIGVLSVWIAYRESSWISAFIWIFLLVTNGSIITCLYIVWQLSHLSPLQPISLIIFNTRCKLMMENIDEQRILLKNIDE